MKSTKIQTLKISNFQKWKNLEVDLHPHATVLVGPTDSGKSSALRALKWLVTNRPIGSAFLRRGSKWVRVELDLGKVVVGREKTKSRNAYTLDFPDGSDAKDFLAAGVKVPDEIAQLLNLGEENFQGQHDSPMWFLKTGSQVAQDLNRIVDLEAIDRALGAAARELRTAKTLLEVSTARLDEAKGRKLALDWVPEAVGDWNMVADLDDRIHMDRDKLFRLTELVEGGKSYGEALESAGDEAVGGREVVSLGMEVLGLSEQVEALEGLLGTAKAHAREIEHQDRVCHSVKADLSRVKQCPACGARM